MAQSADHSVVCGPDADKLMTLIEYLEDLDDVQNVYSNAELPEEELA